MTTVRKRQTVAAKASDTKGKDWALTEVAPLLLEFWIATNGAELIRLSRVWACMVDSRLPCPTKTFPNNFIFENTTNHIFNFMVFGKSNRLSSICYVTGISDSENAVRTLPARQFCAMT